MQKQMLEYISSLNVCETCWQCLPLSKTNDNILSLVGRMTTNLHIGTAITLYVYFLEFQTII